MPLSKWISAVGGIAAASRLLGITRATIYKWLDGSAQPRAATMARIVLVSGGKVSYEDIVAETCPRQGGRARK